MAGHRAPSGRRARRRGSSAIPARRLLAGPSVPAGPSLRTTVLATAAAVGTVATGTFTALVSTPSSATASSDGHLDAALAASTAPLARSRGAGKAALLPVSFDASDAAAAPNDHLARLGKAADIAAQLAELHAQQERQRAEHDRLAAVINSGGLDGWIAEALQILDLPQSLAPAVKKIIMAESGGNPRAINNWDANARRGTPSQGLMQTIPSTFRKYVAPELANRPIDDPVANITAGIRYMIDTYGIGTLQAGGRTNSSGGYAGY